MKNLPYLFVLCFVTLIYLASCRIETELDGFEATIAITRSVAIPSATITVEPTNLLIPSPTPSPQPTLTPSPEITPTLTPITTSEIQELCGTVYTDTQQFPPNLLTGIAYHDPVKYPGELLIQEANLPEPAFQWNEDFAIIAQVSPDGQWVATTRFDHFDTNGNSKLAQIIVSNSNFQQFYELDVPDNWLALLPTNSGSFSWLNNQQLVSYIQPEKNSNQVSYLIWSPFTNEQQVITINLPGYENRRVSDVNEAHPTLDPLLEYIAYPCYDTIVCQGDTFRLLNIATSEISWSTYFRFRYGNLESGSWSFDGQKLAIFTEGENPEQMRLTIFNRAREIVKTIVVLGQTGYALGRWSSDSRYFAFSRYIVYSSIFDYDGWLTYLDLEDGSISALCASPVSYYWAPDDSKIVYHQLIESESEGENHYLIYVANILTGERYVWFETTLPMPIKGWVLLPTLTKP